MNFINGFMGILNSKELGEISAILLLMFVCAVVTAIIVKYSIERMGLE